jgi:hypothetical protein
LVAVVVVLVVLTTQKFPEEVVEDFATIII